MIIYKYYSLVKMDFLTYMIAATSMLHYPKVVWYLKKISDGLPDKAILKTERDLPRYVDSVS